MQTPIRDRSHNNQHNHSHQSPRPHSHALSSCISPSARVSLLTPTAPHPTWAETSPQALTSPETPRKIHASSRSHQVLSARPGLHRRRLLRHAAPPHPAARCNSRNPRTPLQRPHLRSHRRRQDRRHPRHQQSHRSRSGRRRRHRPLPCRHLRLLHHPPQVQHHPLSLQRLHHPRRRLTKERRDHRLHGRRLRSRRPAPALREVPGLRPQSLAQLALLRRGHSRHRHRRPRPHPRQRPLFRPGRLPRQLPRQPRCRASPA